MKILGISAYYHDSAAALIIDGEIISAAQEERFTRIKHDASFPVNAINFCLKYSEINLEDLDYVVFYDKPFLKFERLLETYLAYAPTGFLSFSKSMPVWIKEKLFQKDLIFKEFKKISGGFDHSKILFSEHHISHAASAFFASNFKEAIVLTLDGVGEWASTSVSIGKGNDLKIVKEIHFPHSIGLLYSAMTYYTGFKVNSGEYKVMGLAPYGKPIYSDIILDKLIDLKSDGSFKLNMKYFNYCAGLTMTNRHFHDLFGGLPRKSEELLTQKHMDLAASIQQAVEHILLVMTRSLHKEYGIENLCLAGGVALNCVANGKILKDNQFKNVYIQPAAGDAGGALGAALAAYYMHLKQDRVIKSDSFYDGMKGSYLGPEYIQEEIETRLRNAGAVFEVYNDRDLIDKSAELLASGKAMGWFQGRMEFGPRSLGARSILGDPRSPNMQEQLNLKIKFRESFRPFAPSVLWEHVKSWFNLNTESPYMLLVTDILDSKKIEMTEDQKKLFGIEKLNVIRSEIPSVTHVDYSARIQTVHKETNQKYHDLISKFYEKTGCPVLVNTSFNVRGEPIVGSPEDAFRCLMGTDIDVLVAGNCILLKDNQKPELKIQYKDKFELD